MKRTASAFLEYAIVLGVASAVFITMNTYVKRGVQGRLKEMTDHFINNDQAAQVAQINPTLSNSRTIADVDMDSQTFIGGGTSLALLDTRNIEARSRVEEVEPFFSAEFTPAEEGQVNAPIRGGDSEHVPTPQEIEDLRRNLTGERDRALSEAAILEGDALELDRQGQDLIDQADRLRGPNGECEGECSNLRSQGNLRRQQANDKRQDASTFRHEAEGVQRILDNLNNLNNLVE